MGYSAGLYHQRMLLEVIAQTLEDARAAEQGGAGRLELCSRLDLAGLTPALELVEAVARSVRIPVRVMVRTNDAFQATEEDIAEMQRQVRAMSHLRIDGLICGFLDEHGGLDFAALERVMQAAPADWGLTLHRAFDYANGSREEKLAAVREWVRADRFLTGVRAMAPAIPLMVAGGGITLENLPQWIAETGCREYHVGRAARTPEEVNAPVDVNKVRALRAALNLELGT
jgi:copper homeostasis protein